LTYAGWQKRLLGGLGIAPSAERLIFLSAWSRAEGGSARWNPLNTTYDVVGAIDYNSAHVKHYLDAAQGTAATILTIRLPYYRALLAALGTDGMTARDIVRGGSAGLDTWGTGARSVAKLLPR
jgi:hypothetical protein